MGQVITFTYECQQDNCDGTAISTLEILDQQQGDPVMIDLDLSLSQITLVCKECGAQYYTGDIDDAIYGAEWVE